MIDFVEQELAERKRLSDFPTSSGVLLSEVMKCSQFDETERTAIHSYFATFGRESKASRVSVYNSKIGFDRINGMKDLGDYTR